METEQDVECLVKDTERQELLDEIADEVGRKYPITFDVYDLCEYYHQDKLSAFNVQMPNQQTQGSYRGVQMRCHTLRLDIYFVCKYY